MYRCFVFLAIALSMPLIALPAERSYSCQAPADIQTQINKAGVRGIEDLLLKNPNDFWIRLAYIDSKGGSPQLRGNGGVPSSSVAEAVIERFRKESENLPVKSPFPHNLHPEWYQNHRSHLVTAI